MLGGEVGGGVGWALEAWADVAVSGAVLCDGGGTALTFFWVAADYFCWDGASLVCFVLCGVGFASSAVGGGVWAVVCCADCFCACHVFASLFWA